MFYKGNNTVCHLLGLASLPWLKSLEIHPSCCVYQSFHSFYCWVITTPQYGWTTVCLTIRLVRDIWAISTFGLSQIKMFVNIHIQVFVWTCPLLFEPLPMSGAFPSLWVLPPEDRRQKNSFSQLASEALRLCPSDTAMWEFVHMQAVWGNTYSRESIFRPG